MLGLIEAVIKPIAVDLTNKVFLPRLGKTYKYINPNASKWLSDGLTGDEIASQISSAITKEVSWLEEDSKTSESKLTNSLLEDLISSAKTRVRQYAIEKIDKDYSLIENARRING